MHAPFMSPLVRAALYFAAHKHDGQYRKGTEVPFLVHPALVALGVSHYTNDETTIAAACVHDVLEDCEVTREQLTHATSDAVARLVVAVSEPQSDAKASWKERKQHYIAHLQHASPEALTIVAVDKMHNMESYFVHATDEARRTLFTGTRDDYIWYYSEIRILLHTHIPEARVTGDYARVLERVV